MRAEARAARGLPVAALCPLIERQADARADPALTPSPPHLRSEHATARGLLCAESPDMEWAYRRERQRVLASRSPHKGGRAVTAAAFGDPG